MQSGTALRARFYSGPAARNTIRSWQGFIINPQHRKERIKWSGPLARHYQQTAPVRASKSGGIRVWILQFLRVVCHVEGRRGSI
jgi:hypothetical protein